MISSAGVKNLLESFPLLFADRVLQIEDFFRFSNTFTDILKKRLPTAEKVDFLRDAGELAGIFQKQPLLSQLTDLFLKVQGRGMPVGVHPEGLMLPFAVKGGEVVVALITGADPLFLRQVGEDWLGEERLAVEREFLLLKEARVDIQTGLLNGTNLCALLGNYSTAQRFHLILVELPPKRNSFRYALRHAQKCAAALMDFIRSDIVPHYLGQCTFALVLQDSPAEGKAEIESALVAYLKREGCHRIHIGSSYFGHETSAPRSGRLLLDEAWTALRHAAKRGPFSFCGYHKLAHPESHSLRSPDGRLIRRLGRLWRKAETFTLVHFQSDDTPARQALLPILDKGTVFVEDDGVLVFLDDMTPRGAASWATDCIGRIPDLGLRSRLAAGVAGYPHADFKKPEIPFNCRRALIHAAFFTEPKVALFDSVSMNISGDVYFGDGDLAKAVREYRRGLKCDELNVNLHNSLGVALAMMDKLGLAMQSFLRALALDDRNFMALYNLGLAEQARGRQEEALAYLERARACSAGDNDAAALADDLHLQLGILAGDLGHHEAALATLLPWYEKHAREQRADRVLFHLGRAYHGAGRNRQAMEVLQKALHFNEFDDRAMSLLGMVYLLEKEGDDIALALCKKSVELEPANLAYRLNLAEVQLSCRMIREARKNLYRCLRHRRLRGRAQLLLARSYLQEGKEDKAKVWFDKVPAERFGQPPPREKTHGPLQDALPS